MYFGSAARWAVSFKIVNEYEYQEGLNTTKVSSGIPFLTFEV